MVTVCTGTGHVVTLY